MTCRSTTIIFWYGQFRLYNGYVSALTVLLSCNSSSTSKQMCQSIECNFTWTIISNMILHCTYTILQFIVRAFNKGHNPWHLLRLMLWVNQPAIHPQRLATSFLQVWRSRLQVNYVLKTSRQHWLPWASTEVPFGLSPSGKRREKRESPSCR